MEQNAIRHAIATLEQEIAIELAATQEARRDTFRLRHQVYCVERGFLPARDGLETDEFDAHATHALIRWRRTGEAVGTVRLVLPQHDEAEDDFPVERVCEPAVLRGFPRRRTGEVSRFALGRQQAAMVRAACPEAAGLLRLALLRGALRLSAAAGHTHWLAVMEPTLLRLLRGDGLHFQPLGPCVAHHGRRQPVLAHLDTMLRKAAEQQPAVAAYLTCGGTLFSGRALPEPAIHARALVAPPRDRIHVGLHARGA